MNRFILFLISIFFLVGSLSFAGGPADLKDEVSFKSYFHMEVPPLTGASGEALLWKMLLEGKFFQHRSGGRDSSCVFWVEAGDAKCTLADVSDVMGGGDQSCAGAPSLTREQFIEIFLHVPPDEKNNVNYFSCSYTGPVSW